jgi:glycosyltransferase involved in cell wall biosynthesis
MLNPYISLLIAFQGTWGYSFASSRLGSWEERKLTSTPLVTVLLPLYQHGYSVGAALASIQAQSVGDMAIFVLDDGSSDEGPARVAAAATLDERIRLFRFPHRGIVATLSEGLAAVQSPFVARMDADDLAAPLRLERQLEMLNLAPEMAAVDCQVEIAHSEVTGAGMRQYVKWVNSLTEWTVLRDALFEESPLVHPAALMRTDAVRAVGGYVEGDGPEDYSLWLRLVGGGWRLGKVAERLFTWADPPDRLTRNDPRCSLNAIMDLKVRMLPELLPEVRDGVQVWGAGPTGRRLMKRLRSAGIEVMRIYDIDPNLIGKELHGAPIFSLYDFPAHSSPICLVALGQRKAKALVADFLRQNQLVAWQHFLFFS